MNAKGNIDELFERRITYPDFAPRERLAALVGLDDQKTRRAPALVSAVLLASGAVIIGARSRKASSCPRIAESWARQARGLYRNQRSGCCPSCGGRR
jgi:hypothetical protein